MMATLPVTIREAHEDPTDALDVVLELPHSDASEASSTNVTPEAQALAATKQLWAAEGIEVVAPSATEMAAAASSMALAAIADKESSSAAAADVDDEKVRFEGMLRKRYSSSLYMGSWRYCVVHGNRLRWYMTEELAHKDQQLRGEVFVKSVEPWNGHGSVNVYPHAFSVRTSTNRVLLCSAPSASEKERWVQHLTRCVVSERQRRLSRRIVRHHHDGLSLSHGHGHDAAERRRIVPEDAVRAMAVSDVTSAYGNSINESLSGPIPGSADSKISSPRQQPSSSVGSRWSESEGSVVGYASPECTRCAIRFGTFVARRVICGSCHHAFCSRHCNKYVRLQQASTQVLRKCCMRCARRQEFLVYLKSVLTFTTSLAKSLSDDGKCMMSLIQRPAPADPSQLAQEERVYERTVEKLRTAPMSLIKTIKILYQTRQKPHLFCVACERLPYYVENCIDRVESLWYQILHLFQCCDTEFATFSMQLFCLKRYIAAICRRSPRIALQTIWHVQASVEDSSRHHPNSLLLLLGFLYPPSLGNKVWTELLLADSPEHQRTAILEKLVSIHEAERSIKTNDADSLTERWLSASTVTEFQMCAQELDQSGTQIIDFQSNIHYDSLRVADTEEERDHLEDVVADQVRFVQSLAAISERLRHVQPVEDRSKHLVTELEELNTNLISSALYPLCVASDDLYKVVRLPPTEGKVFSTKMRAPTLIFIEAVPVDAANLVGAEKLLAFTSARHRGSLTFVDSVSALVDETTRPRDSLESSAESDITTYGTTPHHRRHGSQLSLPDSIDGLGSAAEDDVATPVNSCPTRQGHAKSLGLMLNNMTFTRDNNRSASTHSMPNGGFSLGGLGNPTTPRINHARMDNIVYDSKVYGESWEERRERIRKESPHGHLPGWQLFSIIVKTNDDLRQEMFTMQMMTKLKSIFEFEQLNLWLRTYRIVATGANIGLLETINDACSLDHLKKTFKGGNNLHEYFRATYGEPNSASYEIARRNFIQSMAAYSIVSYVLLLKDRHNGNILLGAEGHIIHIDFGFILGIAPGGMFSIEDAPFKLTEEMVMIMGGLNSPGFNSFRQLMCDGFLVLQKYQSEIAALLQTTGQHSPFPCFEGAKLARVVSDLRGRLCVGLTKRQVEKRVDHLISKSYNAWGTRKYDSFQLRSNNIQP